MAQLTDFYPVPQGFSGNYRDIEYTWQTPTPADYSDQTGFTVVTTVEEANTQLTGGNYKLYFMNGTYDWTPYTYDIPLNADFHFRGQSEAGVIFDWAGGSNMFNLATATETPINITLSGNSDSDGFAFNAINTSDDAVAAGVVIGDYVRFSVTSASGSRTNWNLYKITDVQQFAITIEGYMPTQSENGDVIEIVKASSVMDGTLRVENLTMAEDVVNSNHWFNYKNTTQQPYCVNFVFQDFTYINKRSNGYGDLVEDGGYSQGIFDRCKFLISPSNLADCEGPQFGSGDILIRQSYFEKCHTRYSNEGITFEDCYFDNVPIWEDGCHYDNCVFDGNTPAHVGYISGSGYRKFNVNNCRYVNVRPQERRITESKGFHSATQTLIATNGSTTSTGGIQWITTAIVIASDGTVLNFGVNDFDFISRRYYNGSTYFTYVGPTVAGATCYITHAALV